MFFLPVLRSVTYCSGQRLSFLQQDHFKYDEYHGTGYRYHGQHARLYEIMKEKDAIYMKEDFTDEDGIRASELEARVRTIWTAGMQSPTQPPC